MKKVILLLAMLLAYAMVSAQQPVREAVYRHTDLGNGVFQFEVTPPPPGNSTNPPKEPYFEYYWEFGDGTYLVTTDEIVTHTYKKKGTKNVFLKTTGVYDDGDPPPARMENAQQPQVTEVPTGGENISLIDEALEIDLNRTSTNVTPDEENTIILQYKNEASLNQSGRIYLFYNEKASGKDNDYVKQFDPIGAPRIYASDKTVREQRIQGGATKDADPTSLIPAGTRSNIRNLMTNVWNDFENYEAFSFAGLTTEEQSNIFISLQTDADIGDIEGKDVKIKAMLISNNQVDTTSIDLTVAKAHDPNKISVSEVRESFRRIENRFLTYKVQFQNDGNAPANNVEVTIEIPKGLEVEKIEFLPREFKMQHIENKQLVDCADDDSKPCYTDTISENSVKFVFKNVYLPGLKQADIKKYKQTTGSFKYKIKYRKKLKKQAMKSRAHIVFIDDFGRRKPVVTGYTTTRFKPGLSLGPKAGVSWDLEYQQPTYFVGAVASPYKSDRFYYQAEAALNYSRFQCDVDSLGFLNGDDCIFVGNDPENADISEYYVEGTKFSLDLVPLQVRKDIGRIISVGTGVELGIIYRSDTFMDARSPASRFTQNNFDISSSLFGDVQIGRVKAGPILGMRYLRGIITPKIECRLGSISMGKDRLQIFAQWKF